MIATRLHAKRHSSLAVNRPSISSIHITSNPRRAHQQHRKTSKRPSDDIHTIDSDSNEYDDDNEVHRKFKVQYISYTCFVFRLLGTRQ